MRVVFISLTLVALSAGAAFAADAKAGEAVYDKSCKSCHGADGTANPAISKMMKVDIADLKSSTVQAESDADLKKVITDGKGKMKPIAAVTGASLDNVVAYVRSLKK
jgi:mono/diheme cytochrome c family protein